MTRFLRQGFPSSQQFDEVHSPLLSKSPLVLAPVPGFRVRETPRSRVGRTAKIGWSISGAFHGVVLIAAILFNLQITFSRPAPQQAPFHWDVSIMAAPSPQATIADGSKPQETPPSHEIYAEGAVQQQVMSSLESVVPQYEEQDSQADLSLGRAVEARAKFEPHSQRNDDVAKSMAAASTSESSAPPPDMISESESSTVQVQAEPVQAAVLHRPSAIVKNLVNRSIRPDYGWLMNTLRTRLEDVKTYPSPAKANHWQGRVVIQVSVEPDGRITNAEIQQSSGYPVLDFAALEALQATSPLQLAHGLDGRSVVMLVPINYQLE
ncbi:protein of unknown function [Nitrospira japonica]|uniref:TonB C-terminal domain-containing protein n=1 Tax=Nitrospira japonica TaxID=1325564 RepID=A0A1W1IAV8_9BACT|nr:energy transducer TonB [Nitrospira japonica]SLM50130.1 protein of unknown function [Nitrospira japonica]